MTKSEHRAAQQEDADGELAALGAALHTAHGLAKRLAGRGVRMKTLGLDPKDIQRLRDKAEDAYTLKKGTIGSA